MMRGLLAGCETLPKLPASLLVDLFPAAAISNVPASRARPPMTPYGSASPHDIASDSNDMLTTWHCWVIAQVIPAMMFVSVAFGKTRPMNSSAPEATPYRRPLNELETVTRSPHAVPATCVPCPLHPARR